MARSCVFCSEGEVTKEHLFAKWVRDTYQDKATEQKIMEFAVDSSVKWSYQHTTIDQSVNYFCSKCNNGWMSRLEEGVALVMGPMLRAEQVPVTMTYASQTRVASWATKTAFVLQQLDPAEHRVPISYYHDFYRRQQPSSNVIVLIGARHVAEDSKGRSSIFECYGQLIGTAESGIHHTHFAIGAVYLGIIMFIGQRRRMSISPEFVQGWGPRLQMVWPLRTPEVLWPPISISNVGGVQGAFNALRYAIGGIRSERDPRVHLL